MGAAMPIMDPQQLGLAAPSRARGVVGPAMPPLWQYFSRLLRQTSPSLPPKGENRGPLSGYSCKSSIFRVPQWGAVTSMMAPPTTPICAPAIWTGGAVDWWPKAMPPLWQYFVCVCVCVASQTSPSLPPKGALTAAADVGTPVSRLLT
jgi:hypothetical protein